MDNVRVSVNFALEDIVENIPRNDEETAFELIKAIDLKMAAYDFTKKCQQYFDAEIEKEDSFDY